MFRNDLDSRQLSVLFFLLPLLFFCFLQTLLSFIPSSFIRSLPVYMFPSYFVADILVVGLILLFISHLVRGIRDRIT